MRKVVLVLFVLALVVLANMSYFTVDPTEFVYVTQFGRHVATYDGSLSDTDAGLHWRWPWPIQSVRRVDRRLQSFDLPATELLTHDPGNQVPGKSQQAKIDKTLTVEVYVCWRVADKGAVDRFLRRVETPERARAILEQRIISDLGALIGKMRMDDLISTAESTVESNMERLRKNLLSRLRGPALEDYGMHIVDIRLRRFNHPPQVRPAIFARIEAERNRLAAFYRTEGKQEHDKIVNKAQADAVVLKGQAAAKAEEMEQLARNEAIRIRFLAHNEDYAFFVFLEQMKTMSNVLGAGKTTLLLSTQHPILSFLFRLPEPDTSEANGAPPPWPVRQPGEPRRPLLPGKGD
jgi:membrane protease subunit HflC